jgi:DNA-binding transcriptional MerR regulator
MAVAHCAKIFPEATMKIGKLVKLTGIPKETIHFYMREGLLRKPRKSSVNAAEYNDAHLEQLRLIKDLRDNYYLPIPEIKKILKNRKKQSATDQAMAQARSKYFRPLDQLLSIEIRGRENFRKVTGLGETWLERMEAWGILSPAMDNETPVYTHDDAIIGQLMVDMDNLGFGPGDGYDPKDLKQITDFIRNYVSSGSNRYLKKNLEKVASGELREEGSRFTEVMSLFFYHMYRKLVREQFFQMLRAREMQQQTEGSSNASIERIV